MLLLEGLSRLRRSHRHCPHGFSYTSPRRIAAEFGGRTAHAACMDVDRKPGYRALRKGRVSQIGQVYLLTTIVSNRVPLFANFRLGLTACRTLHRLTNAGDLAALCWVLMPDHLHLVAELTDGDLSHAVGYLKARIAHAVNRERREVGMVWERGFHDRALRHDEDLRAMARYVVANPVRARLVSSIRAYPFWDAAWL